MSLNDSTLQFRNIKGPTIFNSIYKNLSVYFSYIPYSLFKAVHI